MHNRFRPQRVCALLLGYARVSTDDQDTAAQVAALRAAGAGRIFTERASGGRWDRPELHRLLDQLRPQGKRMKSDGRAAAVPAV